MHSGKESLLLALALLCILAPPVPSQAETPRGGADDDALPLAPARRLTFEVDEGTWMSVDVHPHEPRIAFDLLGDIYTLPLDGGQARRVLGGMAFDAQPVYSPDGTRIAFVSDRSGSENLWTANPDGSDPLRISDDTGAQTFASPAWSAHGDSLYVSRKEGRFDEYGLWLYHIAGGRGVRLEGSGDPAEDMLDAASSVDGRYLYYSAKSRAPPTLYETPSWTVMRRDLRSGDIERIATAPGGAFRPVLSPDGGTLVYGTRRDGRTDLRTRDLRSGRDRRLTSPVERDSKDGSPSRGVLPGLAFLPSGEAIVVSAGGKLQRVELGTRKTSEIAFEAKIDLGIGPSLLRDVPIETGPVRARVIQNPVQSPDARRIAFSAFARLYAMDLEAGDPRRLTGGDEPEFQPAWSPDGRWIAYVTWTAADAGHVWRVRAGGGRPERLTDVAAFYSDPVFSSDGGSVFALRSSNHERMQLQEEVTPRRVSDLVRIPVENGEVAVVAHAGPAAQRPFVTHDDARVFFTVPDGIVSVRADAREGRGADRRTQLRIEGLHPWTNPGNPVPLGEALLSPDGRWLLTTMANQLYVISVPPAAAQTPVVDLLEPPALPRARVSRIGADYYAWTDRGATITWAVGSTFFRQAFDTVDFAEADEDGVAKDGRAVERFAVSVTLPRDVPQGALVLRGGTAITMRGEEIIEDSDVLVVDGRIAALGPQGTLRLPEGAEIRDVRGRYLLPGFIDTHAHWYEIRHDVLDLSNWSFLINLAYGITAGLDVQAMDQDMFAYQDLIDAGLMLGPRAFSVGQGMFSNNRVQSPQQAELLIRRYRDHYRSPNVKSYLIGNRRQRQWIVAAAAKLGVLPTTEGNNDLALDLTHAIDGFAGNEHALPAAPLYEDVVRLYAGTGIGYTPTLMISSGGPVATKNYFLLRASPHDDPKVRRFMPHFVIDVRTSPLQWARPEQRTFARVAEGAARILRAGGRVGVGSHAEFQGPAYHWEMQALAAGGLTPHEVLRAATVLGSEIIGRAGDLGTLEPGKYADLLILARNPLEDIQHTLSIRQVMKNGRLYDADTLDEIWPRRRPLPPLWFHEPQS